MDRFVCPDCKTMTKIPVRRHKPRKKGHLKWLFCWKCNRDTNQARL